MEGNKKDIGREDEDVEQNFQSEYATCYFEYIESLFKACPDRRRKSEYNKWRDKINKSIVACNKLTKLKIYKEV